MPDRSQKSCQQKYSPTYVLDPGRPEMKSQRKWKKENRAVRRKKNASKSDLVGSGGCAGSVPEIMRTKILTHIGQPRQGRAIRNSRDLGFRICRPGPPRNEFATETEKREYTSTKEKKFLLADQFLIHLATVPDRSQKSCEQKC